MQVGGSDDTARPDPLASSRSASESVDERRGGTLRVGLGGDPGSIDPRFAVGETDLTVVDALFDGLVTIGPSGSVLPEVAVSWSWGPLDEAGSPAPTSTPEQVASRLTLRLGDDAFHDGAPVVAADFVRTFQTIADPAVSSPWARLLEPIVGWDVAQAGGAALSGVRAIDDETLELRFFRPSADFLTVLSHPALAPVPASFGGEDVGASPVGNGRFRMAEPWVHNEFIRARRVAGHARGPAEDGGPWLDEVIFRIYSNDTGSRAEYADFLAGNVDVATVPSASLIDAVGRFGSSERSGRGVMRGATGVTYLVGFNTSIPPFDEDEVRRAVSQLIDRERIVGDLLRDARVALRAYVPDGITGGDPGGCAASCVHDPAAVRDRVAELLLPAQLTFVHNTGQVHGSVAEAIRGSLEANLGVTVDVQALPLQDYAAALRAPSGLQMFRFGWSADVASAGAVLPALFSAAELGRTNVSRWVDDEVEALFAAAAVEIEGAARRRIYGEIEHRVLDALPMTPVFAYRINRVVDGDVGGLRFDGIGRMVLDDAFVTGPR